MRGITGSEIAREALLYFLSKTKTRQHGCTRLLHVTAQMEGVTSRDLLDLSLSEFSEKHIRPALDNKVEVWKEWSLAEMNLPKGLVTTFSLPVVYGLEISAVESMEGISMSIVRGFDIQSREYITRLDFLYQD